MLKGPFLSKDFIGANPDYNSSKIVMLGLPYDCTCSNRAGTRFGPQAARLESIGIETYSAYFNSEMEDLAFFDAGDLEYPFGNAQKALDITEENVDCIYNDNKKLLGIGGEHLITLASVKSVLKKYDNVAVIQFDAHTDLRKQYLGEELTHSGVMYQIAELIGYEILHKLVYEVAKKKNLI